MKKVYFKKFTVLVVATILSALLIFPNIALANDLTTDLNEVSSWADDIDAMLEGKDYVEGEVLALVNNRKGTPKIEKERKTDAEKLLTVSDTAVEETLDDVNLKKSSNAATIQIISNPKKTTKEMLLEMAKDSSVIYAQPNYITPDSDIEQETSLKELVEKDEETKDSDIKDNLKNNIEESMLSSTPELLKKINVQIFAQGEDLDYSNIQDLSSNQWGYDDDEKNIYSVHSPNWNTKNSTNVNPANEPVVAVVDSGLDITHPDFDGVLMDMSKYLEKGLPGGINGYNCSGENFKGEIKPGAETEADVRDNNGHGTHCAGIIAASWDDKGTSGVASGVKILPVKTSVGGAFQDSAIIRAFMYLKDAVDMGLNLYSINCSFGGAGDVGNISLIAINELGQKGVITCIASGNSQNDDDDLSNTASGECMGPYTVCVNAATPSMQATDFTCYGQSTTDIFSPGDAILSTVNLDSAEYFASTDSYRVKYTSFSSKEDNPIRIIDLGQHDQFINFEDDVDEEGHVIKSAKEKLEAFFADTSKDVTGTIVTGESFDQDNHALELTIPGIDNSTKRQVYLVGVKASKEDMMNAGYIGVALKSTLARTQTVVQSFIYGDVNENKYNTSLDPTSTFGWLRPSKTWVNHTVKYFSNQKGANESYVYYDGYLYFTICVRDVDGTGIESKLYIDSIGLGKKHIRYKYMQGTSMATPCITGATAVMYDKMIEDGELTGLTPSQKAIKVANRMKASVNSSDDLFEMCTSGGAFDFDILAKDYTPVISTFTQNDDETFTLTGEYFGNENKVILNDAECEILSWSNEEIKCKIPESIQNGRLPIYVYSDNGKIGTKKVIITGVRGAKDFEGKVKLPDEIANCKLKIAALNGVLYVVPETISPDRKQSIINNQFWAYDRKADKWERLDDIPLSIESKSTDTLQETRIVAYNNMIVCLSNYMVSDDVKNDGGSIIMPRIYASDFYFFNPETKKWTIGEINEDIDLPMNGAIVASEKGLFYCRSEFIEEVKPEEKLENSVEDPANSFEKQYTKKTDNTIYKIVFDENAVKQSKEKTKISKIIPSGEFTISQIQTYGSADKDTLIIVAGSFARWYKWNEQTQKYDLIVQQEFGDDEFIGGQGQPVTFIAEYTAQLTPDGFLIAGFNGANYQKRNFDSFYRDVNGNRTIVDKFACFADLYGLQSTFDPTEGIYYIWGSMYYGGTQTVGYLTYSQVSEPQPTPKPTPVDTGDHNNMMTYFICLILSGAVIVGILLIFKKKFIK